MSQFDYHIRQAQFCLTIASTSSEERVILEILQHLLAAVKELDRRQGVTRFPVGE